MQTSDGLQSVMESGPFEIRSKAILLAVKSAEKGGEENNSPGSVLVSVRVSFQTLAQVS